MKLRVLATILLVVAAFPVATAYAPSDAGPTDRSASSAQDAADSSETGENESETDYTNLYIESDYDYPDLKPGESTEFTVTVKNAEDSTVELDPHVYVPPVGENLIDPSWISIDGDSTVEAGAEEEFTISISVPETAETGRYGGQVAFTDETVTYPGRPERPIHATSVSLRVWKQPTVNVVSGTYLNDEVEAGHSTTKQIVIENTGDEAVPLSPQFKDQRSNCYGNCPSKIAPSWIDIDAPSKIGAGEVETVSVTISPPEGVDSDRYRGELDLGLKDPNRDNNRNHWQAVSLRFQIWNQPEDAFETTFDVSEDTENATVTLSPRSASDEANFDVTFVKPDGTTVDAQRVRVTDRGYVSLSDNGRSDVEKQGAYGVRNGGKEFVYRVDDPEAGKWTLRIMPEDVIGFTYEITRNESTA